MTQIYKVLAEKDEYKLPLQNETPHEDSNIQTDVVGVAEQIEATGVPIYEAEKEAKTIVDDEQHVKYHEEKAQEQETQKQLHMQPFFLQHWRWQNHMKASG